MGFSGTTKTKIDYLLSLAQHPFQEEYTFGRPVTLQQSLSIVDSDGGQGGQLECSQTRVIGHLKHHLSYRLTQLRKAPQQSPKRPFDPPVGNLSHWRAGGVRHRSHLGPRIRIVRKPPMDAQALESNRCHRPTAIRGLARLQDSSPGADVATFVTATDLTTPAYQHHAELPVTLQ